MEPNPRPYSTNSGRTFFRASCAHSQGVVRPFIGRESDIRFSIKLLSYPWQTLASADARKDRTISQIDENVIKLNHYFCPSELEKAIDGWVKYYNERRFHESLDNLTPKDVYLGQGEKIKKIREIIKQNSINKRIFDNKTMKYQNK